MLKYSMISNAEIRNSKQMIFAGREMSDGVRHWENFAELTVERLP